MEEELSSTITSLRNTFMNKIATPEDVNRYNQLLLAYVFRGPFD
jgi:hypothetical protein